MTWYWTITADGLQLWDQTQDPNADEPTAVRKGTGWTWEGDYPDAVLDVMYTQAQENKVGRTDYAFSILVDAAFDRIERV
jgi:hypothetical protein